MKSEVTKDCLFKLKIFYYLEKKISINFWKNIANEKVTIRDFSKYVKNAKAQFIITEKEFFYTGVVGEKLLIATYNKNKFVDKTRNLFEEFLKNYEI